MEAEITAQISSIPSWRAIPIAARVPPRSAPPAQLPVHTSGGRSNEEDTS